MARLRRGRRNRLVVFVREPVAGRVKTRLAAEIGSVAAVWWYRHTLVRTLRRLGRDPRWEIWLAVAPGRAAGRGGIWPRGIPRIAQVEGDLGARMARVLGGMAPGAVVVIGSDVPGIGPAHIARAFRALGRASWVLGPSPDGGYWAIGHRASPRRLPRWHLSGVRWSSRHARADTERVLAEWGPAVSLEQLADVDTAADLARARGW